MIGQKIRENSEFLISELLPFGSAEQDSDWLCGAN